MSPAFLFRTLIVSALSAGAAVQAAPTQWTGPQVNIDFDQDTFVFTRDTTAFGGVVTEDILPSLVGVTAVNNGVQLNFNDQMSLYASSYYDFTPVSLTANFNALFNFTPTAGHIITGYTVTYAGNYSIETPGSVSVNGPGGGLPTQTSGIGGFNQSGVVMGALAPSISGGISAYGDITSVQVFDHYESVLDHYEQVLDYCEVDDPSICYYREEPVYVDVPYYRDETDLGEASISLQTITVTANVAAVPEPQHLALLAAGLPLVAWVARRRRRA
ncbi:MAG: PEP-CTERM sorting domain-containing protein [Rubrivivax sp.]|nr:MAG: PEP-CTERM sorting domain-containing protein [Rubrivivax sp.]